MIRSLRRKVFWSILLSAAGVLLAILLAINVLALSQTASKRESILDSALMMLPPKAGPEMDRSEFRGGGKDRTELLRSVSGDELGVLLLDPDGTVADRVGCADQLDDSVVSAIAAAAYADPDGRGNTCGYEYKAIPRDGGTAVSLLHAASLQRENVETALLSLSGFAVASGLFALVARLLSQTIVKPVEDNMQAQKRFVADASHELKTPLTVIDANVSVLEQSVGPNKWMGYIREQTGRMAGLVNELLQLSDLENAGSADQPRERGRFDAAEAVTAAALPFESVAFERGVKLELEMPDTLDAQGNRKDLEQLAAILIDNAIKHSAADGTVRVALNRCSPRRGRKEESALELRVSNSGDTIPPEALPHIFDRFYRVDESRAHRENSYGLGLAIARGLTEKNGGSITAASQDGITTFTLVLPIG